MSNKTPDLYLNEDQTKKAQQILGLSDEEMSLFSGMRRRKIDPLRDKWDLSKIFERAVESTAVTRGMKTVYEAIKDEVIPDIKEVRRQRRVLKKFKSGKIPREVREADRLIDHNSEDGKAFQKEMERIAEKLLGKDYRTKYHNFKFMLSDDNQPNAKVYTIANPPLVVFTKGLIKNSANEDEIAGVFSHELGHVKVFDLTGEVNNSNPEEAGSDVYAVLTMQKGGYVPDAMRTMMARVPEHQDRTGIARLFDIADPHPPKSIRLRNIENAMVIVEHGQRLNTDLTPVSPDLLKICEKSKFTSKALEFARAHGYDKNAPVEERFASIRSMLFADPNDASKVYICQSGELQKMVLEALIDSVLEGHYDDLYKPFYNEIASYNLKEVEAKKGAKDQYYQRRSLQDIHGMYGREPFLIEDKHADRYKLIGKLKKITSKKSNTINDYKGSGCGVFLYVQSAVEAFAEAQTPQDAVKYARIIMAYAELFDFRESTHDTDVRRTSFFTMPSSKHDIGFESRKKMLKAFEKGHEHPLPWNKHRLWGLDESVEGHELITSALQSLLVKDGFVAESEFTPAIEVYSLSIDRTFENFILEDGKIVGVKIEGNERRFSRRNYGKFLKKEKPFLKNALAESKSAAKNANWEKLETDFLGFIRENRDHLKPQITLLELGASDPFIEMFVDKMAALLKKDPNKFKPLLEKFIKPKSKLRLRWEKAIGVEEQRNPETLLDIIYEFEDESGSETSKAHFLGNDFMGDRLKVLSPDHPYGRLLTECKEIVPDMVKFRLLRRMDIYNHDYKVDDHPEQLFKIDLRSFVGYKKPKTFDELCEVCTRLREAVKPSWERSGAFNDNLNLEAEGVIYNLIDTEIHTFMFENPDVYIDYKKLTKSSHRGLGPTYKDQIFSSNSDLDEKSYNEHWNKRLEDFDELNLARFEKNVALDLKKGQLKTLSLIDKFIEYSSKGTRKKASFFACRPNIRIDFENEIMDRIDSYTSAHKKKKCLEKLLFEAKLDNPDFREWAVNSWIKAQGDILNNSNKFLSKWRLKKITKSVIANAKAGQSVNLLSGLLEEIQAQKDESLMVRDKLVKGVLKKGQGVNGLIASANDHLLANITEEPLLHQDMLRFLTEPLDDDFSVEFFDKIAVCVRTKVDQATKGSLNKFAIPNQSRESKLDHMSNLHKNFWSLPFAARTVYLERVIFPVGSTDQQTFDKGVTFVMDSILPEGEPYADEARKILSAHMEECSQPMQRIILSAMVTASDERVKEDGGDVSLRPGQVLSMVLSRSGAAGGKILQAIHSYMQSIETTDPEAIQFRDDLKASKSDFDRPFRWDIFDRLEKAMPEQKLSKFRIGHLLGSGSYGYTVETIDKRSEYVTATTLARENVEYVASHQFDHYGITAKKLSKEDDKWLPLIGILENARSMSSVESNFEIGAQQISFAEKLYNGYKIKADGYTFTIDTAGLLDAGKEYKEVELAKGAHFNDLPLKTEKDKVFATAAAKACFTVEVAIALSGKAFDYDRHGAQQRIEKSSRAYRKSAHIRMFDHGSLMYDTENGVIKTPTELEKKTLGQIIGNVYADMNNGDGSKTAMKSLLENLADIEQYGEASEYVDAFKRGILALGDFYKSMGQDEAARNEAVLGSIMTVVMSGGVDNVILDTILEKVDPYGELRANAQDSSLSKGTIEIISHGGATRDNRSAAVRAYILSVTKSYYDQSVSWVNSTLTSLGLKSEVEKPENELIDKQINAPANENEQEDERSSSVKPLAANLPEHRL